MALAGGLEGARRRQTAAACPSATHYETRRRAELRPPRARQLPGEVGSAADADGNASGPVSSPNITAGGTDNDIHHAREHVCLHQ
jgi:hypothetical protein